MHASFPRGRAGVPDDPARLIEWPVADDGRWVVGQVIDSEVVSAGPVLTHRPGHSSASCGTTGAMLSIQAAGDPPGGITIAVCTPSPA